MLENTPCVRVGMNPTTNKVILILSYAITKHTTLNLISTVGTTEIKASLKKPH